MSSLSRFRIGDEEFLTFVDFFPGEMWAAESYNYRLYVQPSDNKYAVGKKYLLARKMEMQCLLKGDVKSHMCRFTALCSVLHIALKCDKLLLNLNQFIQFIAKYSL